MNLTPIKRLSMRLAFIAYLGLAIAVGGSSVTDLPSRAWLSFASLLILFAALPFAFQRSWSLSAFIGAGLFASWLAWSLGQLIPLPGAIWQNLGDRSVVEHGLELLGMEATTSMPVSLSPNKTWLSIIGTLPAVTTFFLAVAMRWRNAIARLDWAIPIFGTVSALLGIVQIVSGPSNELYFYEFTNRGLPVGFFANVNHQACFLLMCLPFVAALIGQLRRDWAAGDDDYAKAMVVAASGGVILVAIIAAGSVAGYAMLLPVLTLSTLLARKPKASGRAPFAPPIVVAVATLAATLLVAVSPTLDGLGVTSFDTSEMSRLGVWQVSGEIVNNHWLVGTGPGSFADVYRLYENPETVTTTYANHAHNDYLEAIIEFGLPGTLIVVASVALILMLFAKVWTQGNIENRRLKRAASTALLVVLIHSFVDYPVRTPAIASLFAACFAILVLSSDDQTNRRRKRKKPPSASSSDDDRRLVI